MSQVRVLRASIDQAARATLAASLSSRLGSGPKAIVHGKGATCVRAGARSSDVFLHDFVPQLAQGGRPVKWRKFYRQSACPAKPRDDLLAPLATSAARAPARLAAVKQSE